MYNGKSDVGIYVLLGFVVLDKSRPTELVSLTALGLLGAYLPHASQLPG